MCTHCSADWVEVYGTKYQLPFALLIDKTEDDDLVFGEVTRIYVAEKCFVLFGKFNLTTTRMLCFCHQYHKERVMLLSMKIYHISIPLDYIIVETSLITLF